MASYQSIFKRYEKKYLITEETYKHVRKRLDALMTEDEYGEHTICNIYYDTDCYELIRRSIEKPVYKEKLRVRSYGVPSIDDKVFFELKKKYDREVFKRRVSLSYRDYIDLLNNDICPDTSKQILDEIRWFINVHKPYPRMYIAYDRTALYDNYDSNVRITFDRNIRYRTGDLCLMRGDHGDLLLDRDKMIMEIKVKGSMPLWVVDVLNDCSIMPTSFSKYGEIYKKCMNNGSLVSEERKVV